MWLQRHGTETNARRQVKTMKRVLVPLESPKDARAVWPVLDEICEPNDLVMLICVLKPEGGHLFGGNSGPMGDMFSGFSGGFIGPGVPDVAATGETDEQAFDRQLNTAGDFLDSVSEALRSHGLTASTEVRIDKHPGNAILEYARQTHPTLVLLMRRTSPHSHEKAVGQVATSVLENSHVPVMIVPEAA